jgi:DNA topoisomerase-2
MKVQQFFKTDLCDYASYSTVRQIASYIDGLKNGSRKVIYTVLEQNIVNKLKVLQLSNKSAEYADYLHGSLDGVVVSLGAGYVGTNNVPLIQSYGNFGTRLAPEAAAPRYIFGCAHDNLFKIFDKNDCAILDYQTFEGARIEPKFYVPNLPMLLVNGSSGLATGFRQDILPRNPENLKKYCQKLIEGKITKKDSKLLTPWIKGFEGDIIQDPENPLKFIIRGKLDRTDKTKLTITEMPLGFDYNQAIKHFDKLLDNKVIMDYDDLCDTKADKFKFIVKMSKADLDKFTYEELIEKLKLQVTYTEILCTLDENLKVRTFECVEDIVKAYLNVKLEYLKKRKLYLEEKISNDIAIAQSKYEFIKRIVQGTLVVQKKKKEVILKELEKIDVIVQKDGSYDYLLSMPIYSLTKEKMDALQEQLKTLKSDLSDIKGKTPEIMFIDDLNKISF